MDFNCSILYPISNRKSAEKNCGQKNKEKKFSVAGKKIANPRAGVKVREKRKEKRGQNEVQKKVVKMVKKLNEFRAKNKNSKLQTKYTTGQTNNPEGQQLTKRHPE